MKRLMILISLLLLLFALACNNSNRQTEGQAIELNEGNKWKVKPEMMVHISAAETLFSGFVKNDDMDYKLLAQGLKDHNDKLIASCTMKGKAHDELHKWLHPHLEMVKELDDATSQEGAFEVIDKLQKSFETLNIYFE